MKMEPKPRCIIDGEPWWGFIYEYDWEGKTYGFTIVARSEEEAHARLKRLPLARYEGKQDGGDIPLGRMPLWAATSWLALVCWWRNWRQRVGA